LHAAAVYGNESFLPVAKKAWDVGRRYTISDDGDSAGRSFELMKTCDGGKPHALEVILPKFHIASMVGGTFYVCY
jgi:hypothetical protein